MPFTGVRLTVAAVDDQRGRLLSELAAGPARKAFAIAYDLLGNRAEAEEAVQEALARACENIGDLRDPAAAPAWYLRIVTTVCLRNLRRRKLRRTIFGRFGWSGSESGGERTADAVDDAAPDDVAGMVHATEQAPPAPRAIEDREQLAALIDCLEDLSAQQRAALVLRYGHDLPVPEVAQLLGVELATAKTHLVRGLARLRDLMEAQTAEPVRKGGGAKARTV
jgi:RNA polymerase sigma-70 factor (ECF subfamily)